MYRFVSLKPFRSSWVVIASIGLAQGALAQGAVPLASDQPVPVNPQTRAGVHSRDLPFILASEVDLPQPDQNKVASPVSRARTATPRLPLVSEQPAFSETPAAQR